MPESFADRQAAYAAWRDRLRAKDEVIDLVAEEEPAEPGEDWSPEGLFRSSTVDSTSDAATDA